MTKVLGYASKEDLSTIEHIRKESLNRNIIGKVDTSKGWKIDLDDHSRTRHMEDRDVIVVRVDKVLDFRKFGLNIPPVFVIFQRYKDGTLNYKGWADKNDPKTKAIEHWEFKHSLNPSTAKTFSELIDEL